ncbi:MAG: hypothetical protein M4579_000148 [Chaenotheca gracillima]|nr:MAG: hypothetical protein M4579_000148 [Chaenotheca gracillima]
MFFVQTAPTAFHASNVCSNVLPLVSTHTGKTTASRRSSLSNGGKGGLAPLIQLLRDPSKSIASLVSEFWDGNSSGKPAAHVSAEVRKRLLYLQMRSALTLEDWQSAAEELDILEENEAWKSEVESDEYDPAIVATRLQQLEDARNSGDVGRMLFLIRTSLTRGLGEMGNIKLYKHSHVGTKRLIEDYINSALETLQAVLDLSARGGPSPVDPKYILEQVILARQSFGRSALLLSGGATFGMSHIGVLKTLWEARLLPRIISGASAGSIIGATLCVSTDEEIPELLQEFPYGDLAVFERDGEDDGILRKMTRLLKTGAWIDISHLIRVMKQLLGDLTFQEAYNRTRRILNICVSSASVYELPRLLNYVTAPNVLIWSAVAASCSVPFVFSSTSLLAKDSKTGEAVPWNPSPQRWIDGSVDNDLPMTRLAEMFNVNHFIVSQVNPHVVPFLAKEEENITAQARSDASAANPGWLNTISQLAKTEALHRIHVLSELGIFPNTLTKARSVLSQKYSGDITILPEISYTDFPRMLKNPSPDFMLQATLCGERATWPKLSRVRNHCAIELALDNAVQQLRTKVVFSPSQVDLRLNTVHGNTRAAFPGSAGLARSKIKLTRRYPRKVESLDHDPENSASGRNHRGRTSTHLRSTSSTSRLRKDRRHVAHVSDPGLRPSRSNSKPLSLNLSLLPSFAFTPHKVPDVGKDREAEDHSDVHDDHMPKSSSSSSSTDSLASPSYFHDPSIAPPNKNSFFPFASQPTTPYGRQGSRTSPGTGMGMTALSKTMTTGSSSQGEKPSSPELKYKQLFHTHKRQADEREGTRNMTRRKSEKSLTGVKKDTG